MSMQLAATTAVLVCCLSALGAVNLGRAMWIHRDAIASVDRDNLLQLCIPLALSACVCAASVFAFVSLLFRTLRNAALIALGYLAFLELLLGVQLVASVLAQDFHPLPHTWFVIGICIKLAYGTWLAVLFVKVWPHFAGERGTRV
ncbi:MAG: hypothetical protein ABI846_08505 [Rudaea sp.]